MTTARPKVLSLSSLRACPVRVCLHTEHMIDAVRSSVEDGRAAPGITVALVGRSLYYIVDGHARVEAYKRAELEEVNIAEILNLKNETEVMIEHVRRNLHSPLNPIRVAAIAAHLAKAGVEDPCKVLGISPVMETAVSVINRWPDDVRTSISRVLDTSAGKFSEVHALPHFFATFGELADKVHLGDKNAEAQLRDAVSYIVQYLESVSEENDFALPGPDQIHAMMSTRKQRVAKERSEPAKRSRKVKVAARVQGNQESYQGNGKGDEVKYSKPPMMPDQNKSMVECTHCGRPQVIDLKTGHVCPVESVGGGLVDVIRDGEGYRSYVLSMKAMRFLGLDRPTEDISPTAYSMVATDKKSEVELLLKSAKPTAHFVVIMSDYGWKERSQVE